jgi:hypothetical protein
MVETRTRRLDRSRLSKENAMAKLAYRSESPSWYSSKEARRRGWRSKSQCETSRRRTRRRSWRIAQSRSRGTSRRRTRWQRRSWRIAPSRRRETSRGRTLRLVGVAVVVGLAEEERDGEGEVGAAPLRVAVVGLPEPRR